MVNKDHFLLEQEQDILLEHLLAHLPEHLLVTSPD